MRHLRLATRRCLTTGCVVAVAYVQMLLPSMYRRLRSYPNSDYCPRRLLPSSLVVELVSGVVAIVIIVVNVVVDVDVRRQSRCRILSRRRHRR